MNIIKNYISVTLFLAATFGYAVNTFSQSVEESAANHLPLPSELFAKHIEAIGGEQSIRAHTTRTVSGKLIINAYGIDGDLHMIGEAPNKMATTVDLGSFGESRSGYNGTIGWSMDPMSGSIVLQGKALQDLIERADLYADNLNLGKGSIKQETIEIVTFDDGEQYKVLLKNADGEESYLYFSKETGLLSGMDRMAIGAMGRVPTQIRLSDYVVTDGLKSARRITSSQSGVETIIEINSISYDDLSENAFDLPAEIQALINE